MLLKSIRGSYGLSYWGALAASTLLFGQLIAFNAEPASAKQKNVEVEGVRFNVPTSFVVPQSKKQEKRTTIQVTFNNRSSWDLQYVGVLLYDGAGNVVPNYGDFMKFGIKRGAKGRLTIENSYRMFLNVGAGQNYFLSLCLDKDMLGDPEVCSENIPIVTKVR